MSSFFPLTALSLCWFLQFFKMFLSFPKECLLGCFWNSVKSYVKKEWSNRKKDLLSASSRNLRRKKEEDIDEENLHGTILLLTVKIFARLEQMSKPSSDSSSSLLLAYLNELHNIWLYVTTISFLGVLLLHANIDIGLQWIKMYIQCSVGMVQVHSYHDRKGLGLPFMMETYEILTNRTSLYDRKAQTDCRQTYERQILLCPRKVEAKFRHGAEVHTIMQSGIQRK